MKPNFSSAILLAALAIGLTVISESGCGKSDRTPDTPTASAPSNGDPNPTGLSVSPGNTYTSGRPPMYMDPLTGQMSPSPVTTTIKPDGTLSTSVGMPMGHY